MNSSTYLSEEFVSTCKHILSTTNQEDFVIDYAVLIRARDLNDYFFKHTFLINGFSFDYKLNIKQIVEFLALLSMFVCNKKLRSKKIMKKLLNKGILILIRFYFS